MSKNSLMNWVLGAAVVLVLAIGVMDRFHLTDKIKAAFSSMVSGKSSSGSGNASPTPTPGTGQGTGNATAPVSGGTPPVAGAQPPASNPVANPTPPSSPGTPAPVTTVTPVPVTPPAPIARPQISPLIRKAIMARIEEADEQKYSRAQKDNLKNLIEQAKEFNLIETAFYPVGGTVLDDENKAAVVKGYDDAGCPTRQGATDFFIVLIGYASVDGSREANLKLAEGRAVTVANLLLNERGIPPGKILTVSIGETQLLDSTSQGSNRAVEVWETSIDPKFLGGFLLPR